MGAAFLLGFALLIGGYTLVYWGEQRINHNEVSMWYLISGKGTKSPKPNKSASTTTAPQVFQA